MEESSPKRASLRPEQRKLVEEHLRLAEQIARFIRRSLPPEVDVDELISYAREGLTEAALRYDPRRGASFATFAGYRVKGAIYDGIRKGAYLNRTEYARHRETLKFRERANEYLAERSEEPAAQNQQGAVEEAETYVAELASVFLISLDAHAETHEKIASDERGADELIEAQELQRQLRQARSTLEPKEAELLRLHYDEGLTLSDAGRRLGFSKPWASRLHARAIRSLAVVMGVSPSTADPPEP
jgi:RNA polymerase sigma factor for flagellar operon FliA